MTAALSFDHVSAGYGTHKVLDDVTAAFERGAVTGLVGPNGAGKTTLLRVALGLLEPTQGNIHLLERRLAEWSRGARAQTVAYLPQGADVQWPIDAARLVALGRMPHRGPFAPPSPDDLAAVHEALARCDAEALSGRRMDQLSSGERARVLLARALSTKAPILLADEPAAHLDPAHQLRLMELLREEARRGVAVVATLHDLPLASRYCDEIVVLKSGRVVAHGPSEESLSDRVLGDAFDIAALRLPAEGKLHVFPWRPLGRSHLQS